MSDEWERKRRVLKAELAAGVIDGRKYAQRLRGINAAEGSYLTKRAKAAVDALNAYRERIDRGREQDKLRRQLSQSIKRYQELPQ